MRIYENLLNLLELFQVETTTNMTNEKNKIENTFFSPEFHGWFGFCKYIGVYSMGFPTVEYCKFTDDTFPGDWLGDPNEVINSLSVG